MQRSAPKAFWKHLWKPLLPRAAPPSTCPLPTAHSISPFASLLSLPLLGFSLLPSLFVLFIKTPLFFPSPSYSLLHYHSIHPPDIPSSSSSSSSIHYSSTLPDRSDSFFLRQRLDHVALTACPKTLKHRRILLPIKKRPSTFSPSRLLTCRHLLWRLYPQFSSFCARLHSRSCVVSDLLLPSLQRDTSRDRPAGGKQLHCLIEPIGVGGRLQSFLHVDLLLFPDFSGSPSYNFNFQLYNFPPESPLVTFLPPKLPKGTPRNPFSPRAASYFDSADSVRDISYRRKSHSLPLLFQPPPPLNPAPSLA